LRLAKYLRALVLLVWLPLLVVVAKFDDVVFRWVFGYLRLYEGVEWARLQWTFWFGFSLLLATVMFVVGIYTVKRGDD